MFVHALRTEKCAFKIFTLILLLNAVFLVQTKKDNDVKHARRHNRLNAYRHPYLTVDGYGACHVHDRRFSGYCTRYENCLIAVNAWQQHQIPPVYCYFTTLESVVCCPDATLYTPQPPLPQIPTAPSLPPAVSPIALQNEVRRSEEECKSYFMQRGQRRKHQRHRAKRSANATTAVEAVDGEDDDAEDLSAAIEEIITKSQLAQTEAVGGIPTAHDEFPYMCALGWKTKNKRQKVIYHCGCVLIAQKFVLTAAHCITLGGETPFTVRLGGVDLNQRHAEMIKIKEIIPHPAYRDDLAYDDIAIIKLERSARKRPACLWTQETLPFEQLTAIGYGQTKFAGPSSNALLKVYLNVITNQDCSKYYGDEENLKDGIAAGQICAVDKQKRMDTCQGDSGGPLLMHIVQENIKYPYIVGLTSFGMGCATGTPSIYTRISHYLNWIESVVWK